MSFIFIIHYFLHFIFPAFIARWFFQAGWVRVYLIFLASMLVDTDHLFALPVYLAGRCSIGFHPLHSYPAIAFYFLLLVPVKTRILAIGLLMHMATDGLDCLLQPCNCV